MFINLRIYNKILNMKSRMKIQQSLDTFFKVLFKYCKHKSYDWKNREEMLFNNELCQE